MRSPRSMAPRQERVGRSEAARGLPLRPAAMAAARPCGRASAPPPWRRPWSPLAEARTQASSGPRSPGRSQRVGGLTPDAHHGWRSPAAAWPPRACRADKWRAGRSARISGECKRGRTSGTGGAGRSTNAPERMEICSNSAGERNTPGGIFRRHVSGCRGQLRYVDQHARP